MRGDGTPLWTLAIWWGVPLLIVIGSSVAYRLTDPERRRRRRRP